MPPEEDDELCVPALAAGLNFIRLTTPTTDDRRLPAVLKNTSGFVYYVSMTGITGARDQVARRGGRGGQADQGAHRAAGRRRLRHQDRRGRRRCMGRDADGVVVGTALCKAIGDSLEDGKATARDGAGAHRPGGLACGGRTAVARLTTSSKRVTFPVCR